MKYKLLTFTYPIFGIIVLGYRENGKWLNYLQKVSIDKNILINETFFYQIF